MSNELPSLRLAVKRVYFEQIRSGEKREEYRIINKYWRTRLVGKEFKNVVITLGYPKAGDLEREIIFPWAGFYTRRIKHEHFGDKTVHVFAITLRGENEQ